MPKHIREMSVDELRTAAHRLRNLMTPVTWIKGNYCVDQRELPNGSLCFCLTGAVIAAIYPEAELEDGAGEYEADAGLFVACATERFDVEMPVQAIVDWNDAPQRTWEEVDAVVDQIVRHYETMSPAERGPAPSEEGFV